MIIVLKYVRKNQKIFMKVYKLEFIYFDGCNWATTFKEIIAINMFQLIRSFINETKHSNPDTTRGLWKKYKNYIVEDNLTFPIVNQRN